MRRIHEKALHQRTDIYHKSEKQLVDIINFHFGVMKSMYDLKLYHMVFTVIRTNINIIK